MEGQILTGPIQSIFIGLAMIIFYTLLLSMSEHIPFERACWVATACVVAKIGLLCQVDSKK